jgi:Ca2+-binding EF-hand superfamily protein
MGKPDKQTLIDAFNNADKDNSGTLDVPELFELMKAYGDDGITQDDINDFLSSHDINNDGTICLEEYNAFLDKIYADE